jgi:hypothetical protein
MPQNKKNAPLTDSASVATIAKTTGSNDSSASNTKAL